MRRSRVELGRWFRAELGRQSGEELGRHSGAELGRHSGAELGRWFGAELGRKSGELGRHSGAELGRQSGAELGRHFGAELVRQSGAELGRQSREELGRHSGPELVRHYGAELVRHSGAELGRWFGVELGRQSGEELGRHSGAELGRQSGEKFPCFLTRSLVTVLTELHWLLVFSLLSGIVSCVMETALCPSESKPVNYVHINAQCVLLVLEISKIVLIEPNCATGYCCIFTITQYRPENFPPCLNLSRIFIKVLECTEMIVKMSLLNTVICAQRKPLQIPPGIYYTFS
jgi:hypothetical protein